MLTHLNYLHIVVAAAVYFIIGGLWYSVLFGKSWMVLVNVTPTEEDKKKAPMMMGMTLVINLIITIGLAFVYKLIRAHSVIVALKVGGFLGVCFFLMPMILNNMYARRPTKLTMIDAGYHVVGVIVASLILVLWR